MLLKTGPGFKNIAIPILCPSCVKFCSPVARKVPSSGYYDSLYRKSSQRAQHHERIKQSVQQAYTKSNSPCIRQRGGSAKIAERL